MKVETVSVGTIALIQQTETGRILQVAMTEEQSKMLQILLASISQSIPLVQMGEEYDLVLKSTLCDKCSKNNNRSLLLGTYRTLINWLIKHKQSIFIEADIPKEWKKKIINDLGFSSNLLDE
jgi:hypothetical protein